MFPAGDSGELAITEEWRVLASLVERLMGLTEAREERLWGSRNSPNCSCRPFQNVEAGTPVTLVSGKTSPSLESRLGSLELRLSRLEERLKDPPSLSDQGTQTGDSDHDRFCWSMIVKRSGPFKGQGKAGAPSKGAPRKKTKRRTSGNRGTLSSPSAKTGGGPSDPQEAGVRDKEEEGSPLRNRGALASPPVAGGEPDDPPGIAKEETTTEEKVEVGEEPPTPKFRRRPPNPKIRCSRCLTRGHGTEDCPVVRLSTTDSCLFCWRPLEGHSEETCRTHPFCQGCWYNRERADRREEREHLALHRVNGPSCTPCPPRIGGPTVFSPDPSDGESDGEAREERAEEVEEGLTNEAMTSARTRGCYTRRGAGGEKEGGDATAPQSGGS